MPLALASNRYVPSALIRNGRLSVTITPADFHPCVGLTSISMSLEFRSPSLTFSSFC